MSAVSSARARKGKGDGETRAKILAASEELFAELGYSGTSISKIAKKAGVLSGSIYFCFPSKDDIFATLITEGSDAWREYMHRDDRQESELPTDLKGLKDDLFQILYSLRERPNFVRLMFAAVVEAKTDNKTIRHALRVLRRSSIR
ncbi:MAG: TetR/AcrR family transcriptional regulator, partial [Pseudomonadota bacterium]|nr:TetR/AcrR family transcriptional regulator [Pseudomonadota bacterium]